MAGPTKKQKTAGNSDFKRIKAKVGKKALKPANVTDTSFKAASVSVKSQTDTFSSFHGKLVSERGHSIQDLVTQLNHPAPAVRTSAIRGLSNVVDNVEFLQPHLSILLPAVAKCCVDEDDTVRQLGLSVLNSILKNEENNQVLSPFLALLTAYVTSALNSLDRSTRLDGGRAVEILSTALQSLMGSQAETLLPAFVGLLADYTRQQKPTAESTTRKRKKASDSNNGGRFTILESLVALLRTVPDTNQEATGVTNVAIKESQKPDLVFVPGGRTVNALLIAGREYRSIVRPIQSIHELSFFMEGNLGDATSEKREHLNVGVATDIISKLRDIYIELSQRGGTEGSRGGLLLGATDLQELSLLNEAIRLFWNSYCRDMLRQATNQTQVQALRRIYSVILSLMMESFPVWQQSSNTELASKCAVLNGEMCSTLMDIGGYLEPDSKRLNWTKQILDYLLPRLENDASVPVQGDTVVDVLSKLLLLRHDSAEFTLSEKTRRKLLERICAAFFGNSHEHSVLRLASNRRAALLIVAMLEIDDFLIERSGSVSASLQVALTSLPLYLQAWRGDFLEESRAVLSALHNVARRIDLEGHFIQGILESLRHAVALLCEAPKRSKRQMKRSQATTATSPIFALYTEEMQRQALGLLVMIQSPSEATIKGLGYMCARCSSVDVEGAIKPTIADAIMYAVHSVRRSMSMQAFLSFIVGSIGITNFESKQNEKHNTDAAPSVPETEAGPVEESPKQQSANVQIDLEIVKASEASVLRAARYLILSGSAKVLSMVHPVLTEWLAAMRPASGLNTSQKVLRFRSASSICAMLVLDMEASILTTSPDLADNLVSATCDLFALCFSRSNADHDSGDVFQYLMQPILALLKTDTTLVESIFDRASHRICEHQTTDTTEASAYIEALLSLVRNPELASVLRDASKALKKCCESVESSVTGNSGLERQALSLRTAVELLVGDTQT